MRIFVIPLIATQRALYDLPRDMARFQRYIETLNNHGDPLVPLGIMNPMGKEKAREGFDRLIALEAEDVAVPREIGGRSGTFPDELLRANRSGTFRMSGWLSSGTFLLQRLGFGTFHCVRCEARRLPERSLTSCLVHSTRSRTFHLAQANGCPIPLAPLQALSVAAHSSLHAPRPSDDDGPSAARFRAATYGVADPSASAVL